MKRSCVISEQINGWSLSPSLRSMYTRRGCIHNTMLMHTFDSYTNRIQMLKIEWNVKFTIDCEKFFYFFYFSREVYSERDVRRLTETNRSDKCQWMWGNDRISLKFKSILMMCNLFVNAILRLLTKIQPFKSFSQTTFCSQFIVLGKCLSSEFRFHCLNQLEYIKFNINCLIIIIMTTNEIERN